MTDKLTPEEIRPKFQLCPKCNGQGIVSKPPWVAGDVTQWSSSATSFPCNVCNGAKIIAVPDCATQSQVAWEAGCKALLENMHETAILGGMHEWYSKLTSFPIPPYPGTNLMDRENKEAIAKEAKEFAEWLTENTETIVGERITLYRFRDMDGIGDYTLDDIYLLYTEKYEQ